MSRQPKQNVRVWLKQKCLKGIFPSEQEFRCWPFCRVNSLCCHIYHCHLSFWSNCDHQTSCVKVIFIIVSNFDLINNRENPMERWFPLSMFLLLFVKVIRGECPEDSNPGTLELMLFNQAATVFLRIICVPRGGPLNCLCVDVCTLDSSALKWSAALNVLYQIEFSKVP